MKRREKIINIAWENVYRAIQITLHTGKVKPLYCAIGDINLLLSTHDNVKDDYGIIDENTPSDYGNYKEPFNDLHYISDRFNAPNRLHWLRYGINNRLFSNLSEYFNKDDLK